MIRQAASFIKTQAMNPIETIYQHYIKAYKVSTDSRKIEQDAVFFALKGENFDANDFAMQVAEQGVASLVVADRKIGRAHV